jgi:hypothetical protein
MVNQNQVRVETKCCTLGLMEQKMNNVMVNQTKCANQVRSTWFNGTKTKCWNKNQAL